MLLLAAAPAVQAQSATQTVHFRVVPRDQAEMRPPAAALPLRAAGASSAVGSYGITTDAGDRKITASLDREMPPGTSLSVTLGAPPGAVARTATLRTGTAADVVTAIPAMSDRALPARYVVNVVRDVRSARAEQRTVIYTVVAAP